MKAVILKADGTAPYVKDIQSNLEGIKAEVEGWLERVPSMDPEIDSKAVVYANEEGRIYNLPLNRNMLAIKTLRLAESLIAGNLIVLGRDGSEETDVPQEIIDLLVAPTGMTESDEPVPMMVDYLSLMATNDGVEQAQTKVTDFKRGPGQGHA